MNISQSVPVTRAQPPNPQQGGIPQRGRGGNPQRGRGGRFPQQPIIPPQQVAANIPPPPLPPPQQQVAVNIPPQQQVAVNIPPQQQVAVNIPPQQLVAVNIPPPPPLPLPQQQQQQQQRIFKKPDDDDGGGIKGGGMEDKPIDIILKNMRTNTDLLNKPTTRDGKLIANKIAEKILMYSPHHGKGDDKEAKYDTALFYFRKGFKNITQKVETTYAVIQSFTGAIDNGDYTLFFPIHEAIIPKVAKFNRFIQRFTLPYTDIEKMVGTTSFNKDVRVSWIYPSEEKQSGVEKFKQIRSLKFINLPATIVANSRTDFFDMGDIRKQYKDFDDLKSKDKITAHSNIFCPNAITEAFNCLDFRAKTEIEKDILWSGQKSTTAALPDKKVDIQKQQVKIEEDERLKTLKQEIGSKLGPDVTVPISIDLDLPYGDPAMRQMESNIETLKMLLDEKYKQGIPLTQPIYNVPYTGTQLIIMDYLNTEQYIKDIIVYLSKIFPSVNDLDIINLYFNKQLIELKEKKEKDVSPKEVIRFHLRDKFRSGLLINNINEDVLKYAIDNEDNLVDKLSAEMGNPGIIPFLYNMNIISIKEYNILLPYSTDKFDVSNYIAYKLLLSEYMKNINLKTFIIPFTDLQKEYITKLSDILLQKLKNVSNFNIDGGKLSDIIDRYPNLFVSDIGLGERVLLYLIGATDNIIELVSYSNIRSMINSVKKWDIPDFDDRVQKEIRDYNAMMASKLEIQPTKYTPLSTDEYIDEYGFKRHKDYRLTEKIISELHKGEASKDKDKTTDLEVKELDIALTTFKYEGVDVNIIRLALTILRKTAFQEIIRRRKDLEIIALNLDKLLSGDSNAVLTVIKNSECEVVNLNDTIIAANNYICKISQQDIKKYPASMKALVQLVNKYLDCKVTVNKVEFEKENLFKKFVPSASLMVKKYAWIIKRRLTYGSVEELLKISKRLIDDIVNDITKRLLGNIEMIYINILLYYITTVLTLKEKPAERLFLRVYYENIEKLNKDKRLSITIDYREIEQYIGNNIIGVHSAIMLGVITECVIEKIFQGIKLMQNPNKMKPVGPSEIKEAKNIALTLGEQYVKEGRYAEAANMAKDAEYYNSILATGLSYYDDAIITINMITDAIRYDKYLRRFCYKSLGDISQEKNTIYESVVQIGVYKLPPTKDNLLGMVADTRTRTMLDDMINKFKQKHSNIF